MKLNLQYTLAISTLKKMSYPNFRWGRFSILTVFRRLIKELNISLLHILLLKQNEIERNACTYIGKYILKSRIGFYIQKAGDI